MPDKNPMPATDSARDLRNLVHDDATAEFEDDPKFADSNPSANASSENLALRDTDDEEESDDELEDEDEEEYEDDEEDEEDVDDADEEDEVDDEEDEDDLDDEDDDDDDDDEDYEDDEDEVSASRFVLKRAA